MHAYHPNATSNTKRAGVEYTVLRTLTKESLVHRRCKKPHILVQTLTKQSTRPRERSLLMPMPQPKNARSAKKNAIERDTSKDRTTPDRTTTPYYPYPQQKHTRSSVKIPVFFRRLGRVHVQPDLLMWYTARWRTPGGSRSEPQVSSSKPDSWCRKRLPIAPRLWQSALVPAVECELGHQAGEDMCLHRRSPIAISTCSTHWKASVGSETLTCCLPAYRGSARPSQSRGLGYVRPGW
jgi:hypothetical protein